MIMPKRVSFRLSPILKRKGLTQQQLADLAGLSRQTISSLSHDPRMIHMETLGKVLTGLKDCSISDLFVVSDEN